jgi:hypothetical protein
VCSSDLALAATLLNEMGTWNPDAIEPQRALTVRFAQHSQGHFSKSFKIVSG